MDKITAFIYKKPILFALVPLVYLVLVIFLKWKFFLSWDMLWFGAGGILGIYFMDVAEEFFKLSPSPFRTMVFQTLFTIISFFIITSSGSVLASGLVLSLFLTMLLWQTGEWKMAGNLNSWYKLMGQPPTQMRQKWIMWGFIGLFILETVLFIR